MAKELAKRPSSTRQAAMSGISRDLGRGGRSVVKRSRVRYPCGTIGAITRLQVFTNSAPRRTPSGGETIAPDDTDMAQLTEGVVLLGETMARRHSRMEGTIGPVAEQAAGIGQERGGRARSPAPPVSRVRRMQLTEHRGRGTFCVPNLSAMRRCRGTNGRPACRRACYMVRHVKDMPARQSVDSTYAAVCSRSIGIQRRPRATCGNTKSVSSPRRPYFRIHS